MWSSVGSAGVVDTADISKIVFIQSVAQLGVGGGVVLEPASQTAVVTSPKVIARIRYPVQQAELGNQNTGVWQLNVRLRDGDGDVLIELIRVTIATGDEHEIFTVEGGVGFNRSETFHNIKGLAEFALDFNANVYYVVVTLSGVRNVLKLGTPPAVQLMQLDFA
jgi:hypothetical protein